MVEKHFRSQFCYCNSESTFPEFLAVFLDYCYFHIRYQKTLTLHLCMCYMYKCLSLTEGLRVGVTIGIILTC